MEQHNHLVVGSFERSPDGQDYANGNKLKMVATRMGKITFDILQVRESAFFPQALEKGLRDEWALELAPGRQAPA